MTDKVQKIREEVERLKGWNNNVRNSTRHMTLQEEDFNRGKHSSYLEILDFIDSLQEEPVSEDLEKVEQYIQEHTKLYGNYGYIDVKTKGFTPWLTPDQARKVAEIAREETIKEVCEWIKYNNENGGCSFDGWENDLKKYLEDKA